MSKEIFEDAKSLIEPKIYRFLYVLLKHIIFKEGNSQPDIKLTNFLIKVNKQLELKRLKSIKLNHDDCDINNLMNIYEFIKTQNIVFASEIFENLLIMILSKAFKVDKHEFFGKYIYNNLSCLRRKKDTGKIDDQNQEVLLKWIIDNKIKNLTKNKINDIFKSDIDFQTFIKPNNSKETGEKSIESHKIIHLIFNIFILRYFKIQKEDKQQNNDETMLSDNVSMAYSKLSERNGPYLNRAEKIDYLNITKALFASVYIYYQNKQSSLMNFKKSDDMEYIPFTYELSEAGISDINLDIVLRPVRIESRIENLALNKNWFESKGIFELTKVLLFNKRIKKISLKSCSIKPLYFEKLNTDLKLFQNENIEMLDISSNYLKSDFDKYLVKLITNLKGLKSLNLSSNDLKGGVASLLVQLKDLYKHKKTNLESLFLINCKLDDIAFYELGELLKSKYCKLKYLYISKNNIPSNVNFLKILKKNKSLKELYIYDCGIKNEQKEEIERIMSNTDIEVLYLYNNKIHDFNEYLRIISRNSFVKSGDENDPIASPCLYNLNMNKFECFNRNGRKIELLNKTLTKQINLSCLDMVSLLISKIDQDMEEIYKNNINNKFGYDVTEFEDIKNFTHFVFKYTYAIQEFEEDNLRKKHKDYKNLLIEIENSTKEQEKYKYNKENEAQFKKFNSQIEEILKDKKSTYHLFIEKNARDLLEKNDNINIEKSDEMLKKLIDYIIYKRALKIINENEKKKEKKKMILI